MNDDKRFDATPSQLARAKREGNVARSQDLGAVAGFAAASIALVALLGVLSAAARSALGAAAHQAAMAAKASGVTVLPELRPYAALTGSAGCVALAGLGGSLAAAYVQTRTFVLRFPAPSLGKLDPFKGFSRIAGRGAALPAAKAALVSGAVAGALVPAVRGSFAPALGASPASLAMLALRGVEETLACATLVAFAFACGDALLERMKWKRRLRMTFEELRRDHKQNDGDPAMRGRRRQRHRALIRGSVARVRDAAFVVTNPTHVAIALEYAPPDVSVPRVLVRAVGDGAREVRRLARRFDVAVIENALLARTLLATTDVGDFVPPDSYGAIATIVAMLMRSGRLAA